LLPYALATATRDALAAAVPVLRTERLVLRAPRAEDFPVLEHIWTTDRARFLDGPYNEEDAWLDFAQACAGWLLRGQGYWTVTRTEDGQVLGLIGIGQETVDPEMEFGWLLTEAAEGHGYASEATAAVHAYAFETLGFETLVSYVHRDNTRSAAIARRLGAVEDPDALPEGAEEDIVFRHHAKDAR